jgi:transposase
MAVWVMDQNDLFTMALGLNTPWKVVRSGLEQADTESKFLYVDLEVEAGAKMPCPVCGQLCPLYDHEVKRWRHLNFWQHSTYLSARVPRIRCPQHQVKQVTVPWARPESGFTLMFEAFVMALARDMPMAAIADLVTEHDTRLWRIVQHYVAQAHAEQDWSTVTTVAIDETATRKGHRYATVVVQLDEQRKQPARLLFMTPNRSASCVGEFVTAMPAHGAQAQQVQLAAIDMGPAYQKGVREHLPQAQIVFDRFHVMQLAGRAVDEVRKQLRGEGADVKGALWALRGNASMLSEKQLQVRHEICARHKELGRAMALRESLQETWEWTQVEHAQWHLKAWCSWAMRSRLAAFKQLAQSIRNHWDGILAYYPHRITSAAIESINGIIQTARRRARGFRNFNNLKAICYWMAGDLNLKIPSAFTHPV